MSSSQDLSEDIVAAIGSGDLTRLEDLYQPGISLDPIATHAARRGQPQVLDWCFGKGWTHPPTSYNSAFFLAATCGGSPQVFQVLLDHGWDLNAHYIESCGDALSSAVTNGNYDFAKWLLEHGHRVTPEEGIYGPGVLEWTVSGEHGSMEMLRLLLEYGIDTKESGAAISAADEGNLEALRLLIEYGIDLEERNMSWYAFDGERDDPEESQGTALYRACRQGRLECVRLLVDRGADPLAKDDGGTSCLGIANKRGHQHVVRLLEEMGVEE
ncbi:ankyrin [Sporormia fimetaria CBS 119925]|uniref:Ankyrin n=1 Tax=Sporormia fimetaria CBS 119925 TaxID=1340428 RepID=A0A6A6VK61_9PLEO|nr:ankyrin [Sporormia fimetaria CBS 119925]